MSNSHEDFPMWNLFMANERFRDVSALPGGNRNSDGSFNNAGNNGNWWTATENGGSNAYNRNMNYNNENVNNGNNNKENGYAVRCVEDCAGGGRKAASTLFSERYKAYLDAGRHKMIV